MRQFLCRTLAVFIFLFLSVMGFAQTAQFSGRVTDPARAVVRDAEVRVVNQATNVERKVATNAEGYYTVPFVTPGTYQVVVQAQGFSTAVSQPITVTVGQALVFDVQMQIHANHEQVTVNVSNDEINTTDGSVSTVIGRQFVTNLPLNGRSFQDLISMTPGVLTMSPQTSTYYSAVPGSNGDFSINGQRTESNYYMVDGVAANISAGRGTSAGVGPAGTVAGTSALGTTQGLLSVDDLQEFRVESSSYSAEYGRSPGGQLTFATRSGTNAFHGSAYDYFRNGWFDANDWFNDNLGESKKELHQNDFGGTFGGPVWIPKLYKGRDKTFFFGSYEGLRLTQPVAASIQYVPDTYMREQAPAVLQPLLNAFPIENGTDFGTPAAPSLAEFFQGYSVPGEINSSSIRIDHTFTPHLSAFFRFADSPSSTAARTFLSVLTSTHLNVQTYTWGATYALSGAATDQFRLGYSRSYAGSTSAMDSFGGAVPIDLGKTMGDTSEITGQNLEAWITLETASNGYTQLRTPGSITRQHQWNLVDTLDVTHGPQQWKFGIDFREIESEATPANVLFAAYLNVPSILSNTTGEAEYEKYLATIPLYHQLAIFAQDNWRVNPRLSLSGGLRWEFLPPPHNAIDPQPYTATGNLNQPSSLSLSPVGAPLWHTARFNFAPRLGLAWQANTTKNWETVTRVGGGVFFDAVQASVSPFSGFGTSALRVLTNVPLPLTPDQLNLTVTAAPPYTNLYAFPSHLQNPYTLQWNTSIEQGLGANNTATISYVGSAGRRLEGTQELRLGSANPLFGTVYYFINTTSDYNALQAKFQRSVSKGVTALASYTWSHSLDYGSLNTSVPTIRGNSDFDVRNNFQGGLTWDLPHLAQPHTLASAVANGWGVDGRLLARTAYPITLTGNEVVDQGTGSIYFTNVNVVPNQPTYVYGRQYPGGRSLNPAAFALPTGTSIGNAPRNFARGFGESQVNLAARRDFALSERTHLLFRAEAFNVFNHPNFGYVDPTLSDPTFGQALMMLNASLGTVASQYQQGGPRSMQFALRIAF